RVIHGVSAGPVAGLAVAVGHDARRAPGDAAVRDRYDLSAVLQEGDRGTDGLDLELSPGRKRRGAVRGTDLSPAAPGPLVQHQLRAAVVPVIEADVGVLPAGL